MGIIFSFVEGPGDASGHCCQCLPADKEWGRRCGLGVECTCQQVMKSDWENGLFVCYVALKEFLNLSTMLMYNCTCFTCFAALLCLYSSHCFLSNAIYLSMDLHTYSSLFV